MTIRPQFRRFALPLLLAATAGCANGDAELADSASAAAPAAASGSADAAIAAITPSAAPGSGGLAPGGPAVPDPAAGAMVTPVQPAPGAPQGSAQAGAPGTGRPQPSPQARAALATITGYTLTMDKLDRMLLVQRSVGKRVAAMSPAEREAMQRQAQEGVTPGESIDQTARRIESNPVIATALREAGLSAREYTLLGLSLMQTGMAMQVLESRPKENRDSLVREMGVNPANVEFMRRNQEELARKSNALAAEMQKLGS